MSSSSMHPPSSSPSSSPRPQEEWPSCSMSMWQWATKRNYEMIMCMRRCWRLHYLIRMSMRFWCKRSSRCELVGVLIGWMESKERSPVPIPHTLKGIQYQFLLQSYQNSSPTFVILGIGIPTFGERRGFCFRNFQLRRLVLLLAFLLDWVVPQHKRHPGDMQSWTAIPTHPAPSWVLLPTMLLLSKQFTQTNRHSSMLWHRSSPNTTCHSFLYNKSNHRAPWMTTKYKK